MELKSKVNSWLKKEGYPFEMDVYRILREKTNFKIRHGWHYLDPETEESREIDIVCTADDAWGFSEINFSIECKATSKPWVLFSSHDSVAGFSRVTAFGMCSNEAHGVLSEYLMTLKDSESEIPWLIKSDRVGYSLAQAFEGNSDAPFKAIMSAVKSAAYLDKNSMWSSVEYRKFAVSIPVIITKSPLFECFTNDTGEAELKEIDFGFVFFNRHINKQLSGVCVAVVSEKGVHKFAEESDKISSEFLKLLDPHIEDAKREFYSKTRN